MKTLNLNTKKAQALLNGANRYAGYTLDYIDAA